MSEQVPPTDPAPEAEGAGIGRKPPRKRGRKRRFVLRWSRRTSALVVAIVAALFVSFFTVDLGRISLFGGSLTSLAEKYGSGYLRRPLHIGSIRASMSPGVFVFTDLTIEGLTPEDRPFFHAERVKVEVPWWTLFRNRLVLRTTITDWEMVVEKWADGRHSLPRLTPEASDEPSRPSSFTTTVEFAHASNGTFTYEDHGAPWSVVAPNLDFSLVRSETYETYLGSARFVDGVTQIRDALPMALEEMRTRFTLEGGDVTLNHLDLIADGSESHVSGQVDLGNWPEQVYNVNADVDFPRMRELFFADEDWDVTGVGDFRGVFHIYDGGRDLEGEFVSDHASVNGLEFPNLHGSLEWLDDRFAVTHAEADLYGGRTAFSYRLAPLGAPTAATATFATTVDGVDLGRLSEAFALDPLALAGRMTGDLSLAWSNGNFSRGKLGKGWLEVTPPDGVVLASSAELASIRPVPSGRVPAADAPIDPFAIGGAVTYRIEPDRMVIDEGWTATEATYVAFDGDTAYGGDSQFPFQVTSRDWQESAQLLSAILTASGVPTGVVDVGGHGVFDGTMTGSFRAPRIAGYFDGDAMRAWDVVWGRAEGDIVIEDRYLDISDGRIGEAEGVRIVTDGRFTLGSNRPDGGEDMRATVAVTDWPLADIRHAFDQDDWPVDGRIAEGRFELYGPYNGLVGDGTLRIDDGVAWAESFPTATARLAFEGDGVRISAIEMAKDVGRITGAAWIGWDGRYSFDADGADLPVESLDNFQLGEQAPLTGVLEFSVTGASEFDDPAYEFSGVVRDFSVGEEVIGQMTAQLAVRNNVLSISALNITEPRVQINGNGTIALNEFYDASLSVRFLETSIDPYLKFVGPEISPFTTIIASGTVDVLGPLADVPHLFVRTVVEDAQFSPLDYTFENDGPLVLTLEDNAVDLERVQLRGLNTQLEVGGGIDFGRQDVEVSAAGAADLSILQVFFRGIDSSGAATLSANIRGPLEAPVITGTANVVDGSIRHFDLPHSLSAINGPIVVTGSAVDVRGLRARMGDGDVVFSGSIAMKSYRPEAFNLTASGDAMRLRYPEGFSSTVNANLQLLGPVATPRLTGTVDVITVDYRLAVDANFGLPGFDDAPPAPPPPPVESGFPLSFDIEIQVPPTVLIQNRDATIDGSANLRFTGTLDRPSLNGRVSIDGGQVFFGAIRLTVRPGAIEFNDFPQADTIFDIEAVARPRSAGQTYDVTARATGSFDDLDFVLTSDPWLPPEDIVTLLFGGQPELGRVEQRALGSAAENQERMMQTVGAVFLASPVSDRISQVFREVLPIDTLQFAPVLPTNESSVQRLNPAARLTLGKQVSDRVFLTYSRVLNASQEEIIVLEYDQSDRVSWVLSRNENRTVSLDFRLRYVF